MSPVSDAEATALSSPPRARRAAYLSALRIPLLLALAFAAALGGYYLLYVTQVRSYLVARNFRLLATMSVRIDNAIETNKRILTNLRDHPLDSSRGMNKEAFDRMKAKASALIPILRSVEVVEKSKADSGVALQFVGRRSQTSWAVSEDTPGDSDASLFFRIPFQALLRPLLRDQVHDKTFDLLLVAAPDGRVLFQTSGATVRITNIAELTAAADPKQGGGRTFDQLARSSRLTDIVVSGTDYKLFTQPCCGAVSEQAKGDAAGWVLCGLTAKSRLGSESYSVPFPLLAILVPALLFAVLSWPFVKLSLIGDTQRVTAYDVALVGICTLLATALITVCALDVYGFSALHGRLDEQLEAFAAQIRDQVTTEIEAGTTQLKTLEDAAAANRLPSNVTMVPDLAGTEPRS